MSTKWCKCTRKGNTYLPFALHVYSWVPKCHLPELFWVFGLFENYQISFQQSRKKIYTCRYIFIFSKREENGNTKNDKNERVVPLDTLTVSSWEDFSWSTSFLWYSSAEEGKMHIISNYNQLKGRSRFWLQINRRIL